MSVAHEHAHRGAFRNLSRKTCRFQLVKHTMRMKNSGILVLGLTHCVMTTVRRAANCSSTVAQRFLCVRRSSAREPPRDQLLVRHLSRSGGTIKRFEETTIRLFSRMPLEAGTGTRTVLLTVDPLRGQEGERGRRDGAAGNLGQAGGSGHAHFNKIGAATRTTEATTQCARYRRNIFALVFPRRVNFFTGEVWFWRSFTE